MPHEATVQIDDSYSEQMVIQGSYAVIRFFATLTRSDDCAPLPEPGAKSATFEMPLNDNVPAQLIEGTRALVQEVFDEAAHMSARKWNKEKNLDTLVIAKVKQFADLCEQAISQVQA